MQNLCLDLDVVKDDLPVEILENIYVGSLHAACNKEELLRRRIEYVLNISGERNAQYSKHFTYLSIDLRDKDYSNLLSCIPAANLFIDTAMEKKRGVLVHCRGGRSRSPAVVAAYLMKNRGVSYEEALEKLCEKRKVVSINKGFERQLKAYERCNFDVYGFTSALSLSLSLHFFFQHTHTLIQICCSAKVTQKKSETNGRSSRKS